MKNTLFFVILSIFLTSAFADNVINTEDVKPLTEYSTILGGRHSTPVLVTADGNWRGLVQPGRNIIVHGDTVSVVYSNTTSNPNNFQRFTQAYSVDGGATWTPATVGTQDCMRTYPHTDQIFDVNSTTTGPLDANPYIVWLEKLYPTNASAVNFSKDDLVPYSIFSPIPIDSVIGYWPVNCVWGTGDTLFATSLDYGFSWDIFSYRSNNAGQTWTIDSPLASGSGTTGQIAAVVDNGRDGYGFAYYGKQTVATEAMIPLFVETVDYGQTWSSPETLMNVSPGGTGTLSMSWQGYSLIVDPLGNIPYIAAKIDSGKDPLTSFTYGELYFQKPSGGTPGSYTFDADNSIPIVEGDPNVFEHLIGYPTIGLYKANMGTVLYVIFNAFADTVIGTDTITTSEIWGAGSTDGGVTWNITLVTPDYDTAFEKDMVSSSYYPDNITGEIHVFFCKGLSHTDTDHLDFYHMKIDVVSDLGLPTPASWVGVEEGVGNIPALYKVSLLNNNNNYLFNVSLPEGGYVNLKIFDSSGREVEEIISQYLSQGEHFYNWDIVNIPTGNYIYRMTSNGFSSSGKVSVIR